MAAHAGIWDLRIVISVMAGCTGKGGVSSGQHVIVAVYGESGRFPSGGRSMAIGTGVGNANSGMIRVGCLGIICLVASHAGIGRIYIIAVMTGNAGCGGMGSGQGVIIIMDREGSRFPAWIRRMAVGTGTRNILPHMVRVC